MGRLTYDKSLMILFLRAALFIITTFAAMTGMIARLLVVILLSALFTFCHFTIIFKFYASTCGFKTKNVTTRLSF